MHLSPSLRGWAGLASAALAASACTLTETGTTVSGVASSKSVHISGAALLPGQPIRVQVRPRNPAAPGEWLNGPSDWVTIPTPGVVSGTTPYNFNGQDWFVFGTSVVPGAAVPDVWTDGGLVKLRVQTWIPTLSPSCANGPTPTVESCWVSAFVFDDLDCIIDRADNGQSWYTVASFCASPSSPEIVFVDTDRVGVPDVVSDDAANYLDIRKNAAGISGNAYYTSIGAPATLTQFKLTYGFVPGSGEVSALYYNRGDLGFGRDMHCRTSGLTQVACYVANYGSADDFDADQSSALQDAIAHKLNPSPATAPFATVAMVYDGTSGPNNVRFYVYDDNGDLAPQARLDKTVAKDVPGICLNCHGGSMTASGQVVGAQFLPFDVFTFAYSPNPSYTLTAQQEAFRKLNRLVLDTQPVQALADVVVGLYPDGIDDVGSKAKNTYVPTGWSGHEALYDEVVKPYCRTCHIALEDFRSWRTYQQLANFGATTHTRVCIDRNMPHAQLTMKSFYESGARAHLIADLGFEDRDCAIEAPPPPRGR